MRYKLFCFLSLLCVTQLIAANNQIPVSILNKAQALSNQSFLEKVDAFSQEMLGLPYGNIKYYIPTSEVLDSPNMLVDYALSDEFTYDFEKFDCVTYIETVLALSLVDDSLSQGHIDKEKFTDEFEMWLKKIRYLNAEPHYLKRNHFTSIDWIPNNLWLWKDVTKDIDPSHEEAVCHINKRNWVWHQEPFKGFMAKRTQEEATIKQQVDELLLAQGVKLMDDVVSKLPYISIHKLVDHMDTYAKKFPPVSVVNIVRPDWNLKKFIGTNINVSHQGLAFKRDGKVWFRHASDRGEMKVEELPLEQYLAKFLESPTIKGIHVLALHQYPVKVN